ncbi:hypothetical protein [Streptomyces massasporeus]|uniref:hypothetical protein n=1 Tax=Streptomyces massasporeus TaxID=67324 RepID=UPI0036FBC364
MGQRSRPASGDGRRCEGAGRKKAGTPLLDKPATSELGGVSPTIVLPGGWSEADLRYQLEHIATRPRRAETPPVTRAQFLAEAVRTKEPNSATAPLR